MSINCLEENNQNIAKIFGFFEKIPKGPIKIFANPVVCELYSMYAKDECNSYKCFGKKEALSDSATVSGKDVLLIDFGIIDGITTFRKVCMLYKMNARTVRTHCYFLSTEVPKILKEAGRYKKVSFEVLGDEDRKHYRNFAEYLSSICYDNLESIFSFEADMYNTQHIIKDKIIQSVWTLKECIKCYKDDSYYKISSSKLTPEQSEYLLSTGIIEYMDDEWFFVAESAPAILAHFDSITESVFWLAMDVLFLCNDVKFKEKYVSFFNAYENSAINHNFFGLDINKAEFDRLNEWYSHQTPYQIEEQVLLRRGFSRMVHNNEKNPYYEAMQRAIKIHETMFE